MKRSAMVKTRAASLALVAVGTVSLPIVASQPSAQAAACGDVLVIGARGTNEPAGFGATVGPIVNTVMSKLNQYRAASVSLDYPAGLDYWNSEPTGVKNLTNYITNVQKSCPNLRFILVGHSQGADVVGDAVQANSFGGKVIGVAMTGDPNFRTRSTNNHTVAWTSKGEYIDSPLQGALGVRPAWSSALSGKVYNMCLAGDSVCGSPSGVIGITGAIGSGPHNSYMKRPCQGYSSVTSFLASKMYALAKPYAG